MKETILLASAIRAAAHACGFPVAGFARATPLDGDPLRRWLAAGYSAGMAWMHERVADRLDPDRVLPGARTVLVLGIPYRRPHGEAAAIASYARGRDYHYTHRDRMRTLRRKLLAIDPTLGNYACVDTGVAMEKPWAERAGVGWIGKNGCLINETYGSWLTLSVMYLDRAVDHYDRPHPNLCGECTLCLRACPTKAFPSPGVVDARRCLSYQTIENCGHVPGELRSKMRGRVFGCDVCQDVCPFNKVDIPAGDAKYEPRALASMPPEEIAALSREDFKRLTAGMAVARAQYDGLRRNAVLALGAARKKSAAALLARLGEDENPLVSEAAHWALGRL